MDKIIDEAKDNEERWPPSSIAGHTLVRVVTADNQLYPSPVDAFAFRSRHAAEGVASVRSISSFRCSSPVLVSVIDSNVSPSPSLDWRENEFSSSSPRVRWDGVSPEISIGSVRDARRSTFDSPVGNHRANASSVVPKWECIRCGSVRLLLLTVGCCPRSVSCRPDRLADCRSSNETLRVAECRKDGLVQLERRARPNIDLRPGRTSLSEI